MREEKREKDKGREKKDRKKVKGKSKAGKTEKEGQKTTKSKMEKVISSPNSELSVRFSSYKKVPPT